MHRTKVGPVYGRLAKGCRICGKGAKLVLFATGTCPFNCFYCPISEARRGKERAFANERPILKDEDLLEEARIMDALGAGITGGDPLSSGRTAHYIKLLKQNFSNFHIHLYTRMNDPKKLSSVFEAGVDEIRFHFTDPRPALDFSWKVGAEVPVIPGWEASLKNYILFLNDLGIEFINLNELEFSESNYLALRKRGFKPKSELSYGVKGSEELALKLIRWSQDEGLGISVHYCSSETKIAVQLKERYRRSARNIAKPFEVVTEEGTIVVGITDFSPSTEEFLKKRGFKYEVVGDQIRTSPEAVELIGKGRLVEYWPTFDRKVVEVTPL